MSGSSNQAPKTSSAQRIQKNQPDGNSCLHSMYGAHTLRHALGRPAQYRDGLPKVAVWQRRPQPLCQKETGQPPWAGSRDRQTDRHRENTAHPATRHLRLSPRWRQKDRHRRQRPLSARWAEPSSFLPATSGCMAMKLREAQQNQNPPPPFLHILLITRPVAILK
jgi:hypothetical protein